MWGMQFLDLINKKPIGWVFEFFKKRIACSRYSETFKSLSCFMKKLAIF